MKIDRVQVYTTDIKLHTETRNAKLDMHTTPTKINMHQPAATLEMHSKAAKLHMDSSQARSDLGLYSVKEAIERAAQKGKQDVLDGISRRVQEGNRMMKIENGEKNVVANIEKSKINKPLADIGIKFVPSIGSVKITYQPGDLSIKFTPHKPIIEVQVGDLIQNYTPGSITTTVIQRPSVETTVIKGE